MALGSGLHDESAKVLKSASPKADSKLFNTSISGVANWQHRPVLFEKSFHVYFGFVKWILPGSLGRSSIKVS
jgi:hypothetical protein